MANSLPSEPRVDLLQRGSDSIEIDLGLGVGLQAGEAVTHETARLRLREPEQVAELTLEVARRALHRVDASGSRSPAS